MTGKERNVFERELQKDPFAEEALEGLTSIPPEEALKDLSDLHKRLNSRTAKRRKFMIYRIAASIAVMMVISSIFIIVERNNSGRKLSETATESRMLEIKESKPLRTPAAEEEKSEKMEIHDVEKAAKPADKKAIATTNIKTLPEEKIKINKRQNTDQITENKFSEDEKIAAPVAMMTREKSLTLKAAREVDAKSDSQAMASPDSSVSALNEVVVVGYGMPKTKSGKDDTLLDYSPPQPVGGNTAFNNYIRDNLHRPDSATAGQRVVVVLSFLVQTNGEIDSIRIVRSPGKLFSEEAIRLIKSGPQWIPAQDNGKIVSEEVRIRIVFK
jgi:TonB family protein